MTQLSPRLANNALVFELVTSFQRRPGFYMKRKEANSMSKNKNCGCGCVLKDNKDDPKKDNEKKEK